MRHAQRRAVQPHQVRRLQRRHAHAGHVLSDVFHRKVAVVRQVRHQAVQPGVAVRVGRAGRRQRKRVAAAHAGGLHLAAHGLQHLRVLADDAALLQARHVERLARRAEHHGARLRARNRQDAVMLLRRVHEVRVNLVANQRHVVLPAQAHHRRKLIFVPAAAYGVVRGADHHGLRLPGGELLLHLREVHGKAAVRAAHQRTLHHPAVVGLDGLEERAVHRRVDQHAVAFLRQRAQRNAHAGDDTRAHQHLTRGNLYPVAARPVGAQRLGVLLAGDRVAPGAPGQHALKRLGNRRGGREVHVRHPHREHVRVAGLLDHAVPFLAFGAHAVDACVKICLVKLHVIHGLLCISKHECFPPVMRRSG